tara:strand:+ start:7345 stop:9189 length:1845 start_codon:yes stop_codon:yes gene_type:complete
MCGIFGITDFSNNEISNKDLKFLSDKMSHRGPDDESFYIKNNIGIGMKRLSIIDLKNGMQPFFSSDKKISVVFNGEIYNYKEIKKELLEKGYKFRTDCDVEVLIPLYIEYGKKCIHKINGMFAFVLTDLTKSEQWICRDRLGIKPLYYFTDDQRFVFSSELSGIASLCRLRLSKKSILKYLSCSYIPAPFTIYENIRKVMPGESLTLDFNKKIFNKETYWDIKNFETDNIKIEKSKEILQKLISSSVNKQLISDVPLGLFLSGGLDSSIISMFAKKHSDLKLNTFTVNFDQKSSNDSENAKYVSRSIESNHFEINLNAKKQLGIINELIQFMDEPMADTAIVPTYMVSKYAESKGIKVMLSGAGGDEIFGGYNRYFINRIGTAAWFANLSEVIRLLFSKFIGKLKKSYKYRFDNSSRNYAVNISGINYSFFNDVLNKKKDFEYIISFVDDHFKFSESKNVYDKMYLDLKDYLPNNILMLTDQATMAASVEGRVPLIDHRIVEFAFSINRKVNLINNKAKGLLKYTFRNTFLKKIINQKKEGFSAPINKWTEEMKDEIKNELLNNFSEHLNEIVNKNKLSNILKTKYYRNGSSSSIYSLFILNKWLNEKYWHGNQ